MKPSSQRSGWVDIAKGIAIILVALYHAGLFLTAADLVDDVWLDVNAVFKVFRMPLFFFASGLFAGSVIARSWPRLWQSRLSLLVWTFALWSVIRFAFFHGVDSPLPGDETNPLRLAASPLWPQTGLWFLHALVVFFVATKLLQRWRIPVWLQLGAAAVVAVPFFAGASIGNISYDGMLAYFVFFLTACHFRTTIMPAVERCGMVVTGFTLAVFGTGYYAISVLGIARVPGPMFVLAVVALAAGLLLSRQIDRVGSLARPLRWIGRQTLPIYVAHVLLTAALTSALLALADTAAVSALSPVLPLLVMVTAVAGSLALWRVTRDLPVLRYLYATPPPVADLCGLLTATEPADKAVAA